MFAMTLQYTQLFSYEKNIPMSNLNGKYRLITNKVFGFEGFSFIVHQGWHSCVIKDYILWSLQKSSQHAHQINIMIYFFSSILAWDIYINCVALTKTKWNAIHDRSFIIKDTPYTKHDASRWMASHHMYRAGRSAEMYGNIRSAGNFVVEQIILIIILKLENFYTHRVLCVSSTS